MKEKMILFIIGVLVGATVATGIFLVYSKSNNSNLPEPMMNGGTPPSMPENG